jgi:hypothetical protein
MRGNSGGLVFFKLIAHTELGRFMTRNRDRRKSQGLKADIIKDLLSKLTAYKLIHEKAKFNPPSLPCPQ